MDRRVTQPKRVTSPTWGPSPPCKQAPNNKNNKMFLVWFSIKIKKKIKKKRESERAFSKMLSLQILTLLREQLEFFDQILINETSDIS